MKEHFKEQIRLIKLVKKYLINCKKTGVDIALSPKCFITTWALTPGYFKLKSLTNSSNFSSFFINSVKDLFSICFHHDIFCKKKSIKKNKVNNLIISYCKKKNFKNDGSFYDDYFKTSSRNTDSFWFLISLDNFEPANLNKNIFVIKKKHKNSFSIFYLLNYLLNVISRNFFSFRKLPHEISNMYVFMKEVRRIFYLLFKNTKINNLILNYEGIPFQHGIIKEVKKINFKTKVICYLHCAGWPLQLDLIYRLNLIDKLIVSGKDQKNVLKKFLNWPNKKISIIPSLRFQKSNIKNYGGFIFVPYEITSFKKYLNSFDVFLNSAANKSINYFKLRIHPLNKNSDIHKEFAIELRKKIKKYKNKFSKKLKKNCSFIFGSATGVSIQTLEYGVKIYHIPDNENIDVFSNKIWPNIKVKKSIAGVYEYCVKKRGQMFQENSSKNNFERYLLPLTLAYSRN